MKRDKEQVKAVACPKMVEFHFNNRRQCRLVRGHKGPCR